MRQVLAELERFLNEGRQCVYCSVIETRGSTPQKAGASMLILPDGSQRGTLGGGCVEAEVKGRALRCLATGRPEIHTFCLDDNYGWDDGLICGGRMTILAQPIGPAPEQASAVQYFHALKSLLDAGLGGTEVVVQDGKDSGQRPGDRYLFAADGGLLAQLSIAAPPAGVAEQLLPCETRPRPALRDGLAFLPLWPRVTLLIVGGGHVGQAVADLAHRVDFNIWIADDRDLFVSAERFPMAERRFRGDIGGVLKELAPGLTTSFYGLIVTRGHAHDEEALFHLATTSAGYVGMIGSKRKIKLIFEDLIAKGISREALDRVRAPLGLDIGSQTVPEIAVSIVAELIARRNLGPKRETNHTAHKSTSSTS